MLLAQENVQLHLHFKQPATDLKKIGVGIAQVQSFSIKKSKSFEVFTDTQTSMLFGIPKSAICVQRFDDSLNSAIHITYRISLRSSSMREPRDPLSRRPSGLRKTKSRVNSLAHRTTWLRSDLFKDSMIH